MTTAQLMPSPLQTFRQDNGLPAAWCKLYTFDAGTSTPRVAFRDPMGLIPHENPITLDAKGEALIYFLGNYKIDLRYPNGAQVSGYPVDNFQTIDLSGGLSAADGSTKVGYANSGTAVTVEKALDILYLGVKNPMNPKYAGGAVGNGIANDYAALSACYADASSPYVSIPAGKTLLVNSTIAVPSGTKTIGNGTIKGTGTVGIFSLTYPSAGTTFDGITIDGGKTSGTADVVTLIYAPGSTATPTSQSRALCVRNCTLLNGSAGVAFENAIDCTVHDNHISAMYRHTTGPYAGSYGYGVVFNGCVNSKIHSNTIGTSTLPIERHGIYLPVFLDNQVGPTVLIFAASIQIYGNRISVRHDPANEAFSSCIESWNYFDISIIGNQLIGGVRGINSAPDYQSGGRVQIIGNLIKDNDICIRNDRTDKGTAPGTYYFDLYQVEDNELMPLTSVANHQGMFIQGVKTVLFKNNIVRGSGSTTFAAGYYDVTYNNIMCDLFSSTGNVITGFAQGFYLANVTKFVDSSAFRSFTGAPLPYVRNAAIASSEMAPKLSPFTSLYGYNTGDWAGVSYYESALDKLVRNNGTCWVDTKGIRVRGTTAQRPDSLAGGATTDGGYAGLEYGFKYYDETAAAMLYWNGLLWGTSQQLAPPRADTTANLNTFKTANPAALTSGARSWNTTTAKPVYFDGNATIWRYADGTAM